MAGSARLRRLGTAIGLSAVLASLPIAALAADLRQGRDVTVGTGQTTWALRLVLRSTDKFGGD